MIKNVKNVIFIKLIGLFICLKIKMEDSIVNETAVPTESAHNTQQNEDKILRKRVSFSDQPIVIGTSGALTNSKRSSKTQFSFLGSFKRAFSLSNSSTKSTPTNANTSVNQPWTTFNPTSHPIHDHSSNIHSLQSISEKTNHTSLQSDVIEIMSKQIQLLNIKLDEEKVARKELEQWIQRLEKRVDFLELQGPDVQGD